MATPTCTYEANVGQFYNSNQAQCPRCQTSFLVDAPPLQILASDVMADLCPACGLFVLINLLQGRVIFEGFLSSEDQDARIKELSHLST